jgi:pyridoxal phosphate enzyme (YggS family)
MTLAPSLLDRYHEVRGRVAEAARRAGRRAEDVLIVAVTKYAELDQIRELVHLGHRDLGENRVQQLVQRAAVLEEHLARHRVLQHAVRPVSGGLFDPPAGEVPDSVRWHMVGHLQRNKARKVIEVARLIHSVDSLRLAEEIQSIALRRDRPVEILLQVNCSGEASKSGCPMPAAAHLAAQIDTMVMVRLRGLMTMGPLEGGPAAAAPAFARCREVFEDIARHGTGEGRFNILSMGMSGDYEAAIREGANVVRVGSAIFGQPVSPAPDEEPPDDS